MALGECILFQTVASGGSTSTGNLLGRFSGSQVQFCSDVKWEKTVDPFCVAVMRVP